MGGQDVGDMVVEPQKGVKMRPGETLSICKCTDPRAYWAAEPRSFLFWALVVILFPLGLALLFIPSHRILTCRTCGGLIMGTPPTA